MDRLNEESGETEGEFDDDEFAIAEESDQPPPTEEQRAEIERQLDELHGQQDALHPRQRELESRNRELDAAERSLDAREDRLEREAETKLWSLIDAAVRSGTAKPAESP